MISLVVILHKNQKIKLIFLYYQKFLSFPLINLSWKMNVMRELRIDKVTLNIGTGKEQAMLEKSLMLLQRLGEGTPVKTFTNKRIPEWGVRPGLPIGCMITLRKEKAIRILANLLKAVENSLKYSNFDKEGNVSFGIPEYIDIPGMKYEPSIGIIGLNVSVTIQRAGFRIKKRKLKKRIIPVRHRVTREEAIEFMKSRFNVVIAEHEN